MLDIVVGVYGKVLFVEEEVALTVSKGLVLSGLILDDEVVFFGSKVKCAEVGGV